MIYVILFDIKLIHNYKKYYLNYKIQLPTLSFIQYEKNQ